METTLYTRASGDLNFKEYYYKPSMAAAIIFIILFGASTALHSYQMIRTRTWFMVPFVIGTTMETVGYVGRAISSSENPGPYTLGPYIMQSLLLLVAPALLAASIYMELGRIVIMIKGEQHLFIRRTWLTKIFVTGDVISFMVQASGAGLLSSGDAEMIDAGKNIVVGGLFIQVIFFGMFVIATAIFHFRMHKAPTPLSFERPWTRHMVSMYIVSMLIFVRCIIRVIEYIQGYDGYLMTHEVYLYVFDAAVMLIAVACMNWIHPGEVAGYVRQMRQDDREAKTSATQLGEMNV